MQGGKVKNGKMLVSCLLISNMDKRDEMLVSCLGERVLEPRSSQMDSSFLVKLLYN